MHTSRERQPSLTASMPWRRRTREPTLPMNLRGWCALAIASAAWGCDGPLAPLDASALVPTHTITTSAPLHLSAAVERTGRDRLHVILKLANPGPDTVRVETGMCPVRLRGFTTSDLREPAVWDDQPPPPPPVFLCPDVGLGYAIPPAGSDTLRRGMTETALGMGMPPSHLYFGVIVDVNGERLMLDAGRAVFE